MLRRLLALVCLGLALSAAARQGPSAVVAEAALPAEARETLRLIDRGGSFPHRRDGIVFQNRERRLLPGRPAVEAVVHRQQPARPAAGEAAAHRRASFTTSRKIRRRHRLYHRAS